MCEHLACCRCHESCPRHVAPRRTPQGPSAPCPLETPQQRGASHWGRVAPGAPGTGPAGAGSRPAGRVAAAHTGCFQPRLLETCSATHGRSKSAPPSLPLHVAFNLPKAGLCLEAANFCGGHPHSSHVGPEGLACSGKAWQRVLRPWPPWRPHTPWPPDPTTWLPLFSISPFSSRANSLFQAVSDSWVPFISISCFWSLVELYFSDVNCSEHAGQCWFPKQNSVIAHTQHSVLHTRALFNALHHSPIPHPIPPSTLRVFSVFKSLLGFRSLSPFFPLPLRSLVFDKHC